MKKVYLFLINDGEYQLSLKRAAEKAARQFGFDLRVFFADDNPKKQQDDMFNAAFGKNDIDRPHAIIASLAKYGMHADAVMQAAAERGTHVIYVNHVSPKLAEMQQRFLGANKKALVAFVGPDQYKAGCIQGEQLLRLMPQGGEVLYITGPNQAFAAAERKRGIMEIIENAKKSGTQFKITEREGDWKLETAKTQTLNGLNWLRYSSGDIKLCVVAQSDPMGKGAHEALIELDRQLGSSGSESDRERQKRLNLTKVPVLGIDGLEYGMRWVNEGILQGTVAMQSCTSEALELIDRFDREGKGGNIFLNPVPYDPQAARSARTA